MLLSILRLSMLVALAGVARADISTSAPTKTGTAALRLLEPWRKCAALQDLLPFNEHARLDSPTVDATPTPEGVDALVGYEGNGRDGYGRWTRLRLQRGRCSARGDETSGPKEWVESGLHLLARGAAQPTLAEVATWSGATVVEDANSDNFAAARLVVRLSADDHEWRAQPEHAGRPHGSPAAIWAPQMLRSAGIDRPWLSDGEIDFDAVTHGPIREPRLLAKKGDFEVWELRWRARNGGGIVAVYDRARNRHRWLWGTHHDWSSEWGRGAEPKPFIVERFEGDQLILRTEFERVITRVSIDLRTGAIRESVQESAH